jgi:hypothetical protein
MLKVRRLAIGGRDSDRHPVSGTVPAGGEG